MMLPDVSSPARLAHQPRRGTPRASNRQHDEHGEIAGAASTGTALTGTVHMPTDAIANIDTIALIVLRNITCSP